MRNGWNATLVALPALVGLVLFALWYAADRGIPLEIAAALLPAFLIEIALYLAACLSVTRERLDEFRPAAVALGLTLTAPLSYLAYAVPAGAASPLSAIAILALAGTASFWYLMAGQSGAADGGFLVLIAAPVLVDAFEFLYPDIVPRLPMRILGAIMWYRTALLAILVIRRLDGVGFGLMPKKHEWLIGVRNFLWFIPLGLAAALAIGFVQMREVRLEPRTFLLMAATFVGVLWVLAVAEEFFFRGLIQQLLSRLLGSNTAGLVFASVLFGLAHLGYREFPNWRFALVATLAGIFYGRAYLQAQSIRAAMVTHALVVTVWKTFLT
jgi:membrane protease YdiL (CAAX protease family)